MLIQNLEKVTLLDFPGRVSAVIFTYGCNLRCPYCHNPELVTEECKEELLISEKEVFSYLKSRKGKLDGLVITGGEPTVHKDLIPFMKKVKALKLGLEIKLDTNGTFPDTIKEIIDSKLVDYWAVDIKYETEIYEQGLNGGMKFRDIKKSIKLIQNSGAQYEFRTTVMKGLHTLKVMKKIGELIKGSPVYYIQNFRAGKSIDKSLNNLNSFSEEELEDFAEEMRKYAKEVIIRN